MVRVKASRDGPFLRRFSKGRKKLRLAVLATAFLLGFVKLFSIDRVAFHALCRLVTSYLDAHRDSQDDALWRGARFHETNTPDLDTRTARIDLVVSHCDRPVDWIFEWADPLGFRNTTIYSKCGKPVVGAPPGAKIVRLENVGRCDHTYAHFMANYPSDGSSSSQQQHSDFVLFLKDNDNSHRSHYGRHKSLDELMSLTNEFGFACHEESNWIWSQRIFDQSGVHPICEISYYHGWDNLREYAVEKYARLRRDANAQFQSRSGRTLGDYAANLRIEPPKPSSSSSSSSPLSGEPGVGAAGSSTGGTPNNAVIVPVCYGGNFMARTERIWNRDPGFWKRIESSLSRSDNIAEGHYMERLWGTVLAEPLRRDLASRILARATQPGSCLVDKNHVGALTKKR